ncbi:MAG: hypothetical protein U0K57_07935 [Lachnospiraceae bacterium]|nr:hypothetical protein [Lachnospiraceae bacterium]
MATIINLFAVAASVFFGVKLFGDFIKTERMLKEDKASAVQEWRPQQNG